MLTEEQLRKYKGKLLSLKARCKETPLDDWINEALSLLLLVRQEATEELLAKLNAGWAREAN
jgi:hypothetical protein